uniref:Uncharacterized protein n=1 Tax=Arundo donax TaxID=35708 RepID=A0A0A9B867_ARUDO
MLLSCNIQIIIMKILRSVTKAWVRNDIWRSHMPQSS